MENTYGPKKVPEICDMFVKTFLADDTEALMNIIADDCEWNIMATGVQVSGITKIKELTAGLVTARARTKGACMELYGRFAGDGRFCVEYIQHVVIADQWPLLAGRAKPGALVSINSCMVCRLNKDGMIDRLDEYFDLGLDTSPKIERQLYS